MSSVSATIYSIIEKFNISNGEIEKISSGNLNLIYYFTDGSRINVNENQGKFIFAPEESVYCWSGCNIYPQFSIYREDVQENGNLIASQDLNIQNGFNRTINKIIGISTQEKVDYSPETITLINRSSSFQLNDSDDFSVEWKGRLIIEDSGTYTLYPNISGDYHLTLSNSEIIEPLNESNNTYLLRAGNYSFKILYDHNKKEGSPNIYWESSIINREIIPPRNLIFENGTIQFYSPKETKSVSKMVMSSSLPVSYNITYSLYPSGEIYIPLNRNSTSPLILVHGAGGKYPYWNQIPQKLSDLNNDVFEFYYGYNHNTNISNFMNAGIVKFGIDKALSYYPANTKANVVAHSMGNLVVLGYIDGLGIFNDTSHTQVAYSNNIGRVIMIGAPLHGSYLSNRVLNHESAGIVCGMFVDPDDSGAQSYLDLAVGSEFSWLLNEKGLNPNIQYLSITGNDWIPCIPRETPTSDSLNANDGFVSVSSASLLDKNVPLILFNGDNHANEIGEREGCSVRPGGCKGYCQDMPWYLGGALAWCHTESKVDREVNVINGFFKNYSVSTLKGYLLNGDYYIDPLNSSSNPYSKGAVVLKINSNSSIESVTLKNNLNEYSLKKYTDIAQLTDTHSWFYFSNSQSLSDSDSNYGLIFPKGNYSVIVNDFDINQTIEVKGAQTTMKELSWNPVNSPPVNKTNFTSFIKTSSCGGMCIRYNYTINLPATLPEGIRYDPQFSQTSNNVRILDSDNKALELKTPDVCNDPGNIVPTCPQTNEFEEVIYNGFNLNKGSCTTASSGTKICWSSGELVVLETNNPICNPLLQNTSKSSWSNISCLISDKLNQSRNWIQYDSNNCGLIQNQSFIEYQTNEACNFCNPYIINTTMSTWQNQTSCLLGDYYIQNRSKVEYDSNYSTCFAVTNLSSDLWNNGVNKTYWEFRNQTCDFCKPQIVNTSWSNWLNISCLQNNFMNQSRFLVQYDSNNCGEVLNKTIYGYRATENCLVINPPNATNSSLLLINPLAGIYGERSVMFNLSSQEKFVKLVYSDNGGRESSLCTNCNRYAQKKTLGDGNHVLFFRGILPSGKNVTNQTELFIDSKDPQISTTKPQSRGFTNGSNFYIKYTEDNCVLLNLTVKRNQTTIVNSNNCSNGRNVERFISQDINSFDGQEVEYQFIITDIAGNKDESRPTKIRVDTTAPQILQFTNWTSGNYAYFNMTINELNFNKVEYFDNSDSRARWNSICTSLKNGNCYKKISFRDGSHNLTIRITDDAGNAIFKNVAFTAV